MAEGLTPGASAARGRLKGSKVYLDPSLTDDDLVRIVGRELTPFERSLCAYAQTEGLDVVRYSWWQRLKRRLARD